MPATCDIREVLDPSPEEPRGRHAKCTKPPAGIPINLSLATIGRRVEEPETGELPENVRPSKNKTALPRVRLRVRLCAEHTKLLYAAKEADKEAFVFDRGVAVKPRG